jgi:hypothetical protein
MALVDTYYIGAYWGDRGESVDVCARRAARLLAGLAACDGMFARWYEKGRSRSDALSREVGASEGALRDLLLSGRNRKDADGGVIERLGFGLSLWTGGEDGESADLMIKCGLHAATPGLMNSCVIGLPHKGDAADRLLRVEPLLKILKAVVETWEPDWAVVNSRNFREKISRAFRKVARQPAVGWMLYLSARQGLIPTLPGPSSVTSLGAGSLIVLTEDRLTASRPDHLNIAEGVRTLLDRAGVLEPMPLISDQT